MKNPLKIYFLIFIFFIFSTYNSKYNKESFSIFFPIKEIYVENNVATNLSELKSDLNSVVNTSLFFLDKDFFLFIINNHDFISNIELKKKYPSTLKITIIEKIPIATQIIDKKKFYITKDNEKINFVDLEIYDDLPLIFGQYKNFNVFYSNLKKNNFKLNEIKAFYYFESDRWDILLKNKRTIKLPKKNYQDLLPKINLMLDDSSFYKYNVFDFRIKDQLILR
tara:strand:+ start:1194 stop:1862 length:669 start_codon:yes stop_codon:yes gene_type:complete